MKKTENKKPKGKGTITESISFSYRKDQKEILSEKAKDENRSLSNYIQMVLDKHIAEISNEQHQQ